MAGGRQPSAILVDPHTGPHVLDLWGLGCQPLKSVASRGARTTGPATILSLQLLLHERPVMFGLIILGGA